MSGEQILDVQGLVCGYDGFRLRDVSFQVKRGEFVGIIGPNGSGKTTLLHCLNGLLRARGEIILNGEPLRSMTRRQIASAMGLVSQKEEIHFPFSVLEVLLMGRYPRLAFLQSPGRDDYSRVHEVASMMGINHLL
ncbi:MAG TPA: ABC transporter ATP-binding protein, partial [bacterium]|nr:ABC transporter ATP-binding protein [bacterium]